MKNSFAYKVKPEYFVTMCVPHFFQDKRGNDHPEWLQEEIMQTQVKHLKNNGILIWLSKQNLRFEDVCNMFTRTVNSIVPIKGFIFIK